MAFELRGRKWRLAVCDGAGQRQVVIKAGAMRELLEQIGKAKMKRDLPEDVPVVSCYEAGRDGFWLHRQLTELGIDNQIVDAASEDRSARCPGAVGEADGLRVAIGGSGRWYVFPIRCGKICASFTVSASSCAKTATARATA